MRKWMRDVNAEAGLNLQNKVIGCIGAIHAPHLQDNTTRQKTL